MQSDLLADLMARLPIDKEFQREMQRNPEWRFRYPYHQPKTVRQDPIWTGRKR